jgi:hypothetical protein
MRNSYIIFFLFLFGFSSPSFAQESKSASCTKIMQDFDNTSDTVPDSIRQKIDECFTFCEKIPDYIYAADHCGVDDCKLQYAQTGQVSNWCRKLAKFWQNKQGSVENPLASMLDSYGREDFMDCIKTYNATGNMPDSCCGKVSDIRKYNGLLGSKLISYCSQMKPAQVCIRNYSEHKGFSPACCAYSRANNLRIEGTPFFADKQQMAKDLDISAADACHNVPDMSVITCLTNFKKTGKYDYSCCKAYNNGLLVPQRQGMNYQMIRARCSGPN